MNQELILILKQIATSHEEIRDNLCLGDSTKPVHCTKVYCEYCILFPDDIEYQPYAIDLGEPNE